MFAMSEQPNNEQNDSGPESQPTGSPGGGESIPGAGPQQPDVSSDDKVMALLCHVLAIFTSFIGPLIIWLIKKDQSSFIDHHGKEALNFQITVLIAYIVSYVLVFVAVGCVLLPAIGVANLVFCILAALAANNGQLYRYPLTIRLIS